MKRCVIYKLTSPSNKSYIGFTTDFNKRMYEHSHLKTKYIISKAINKYGFENFKIEILKEVENPKLLPILEKHYIEKFNTFVSGYNMTKGGNGAPGRVCSEETKRKMSIAKKGKKFTEKHRKNLSKSQTGVSRNKGKHHSEETKQKISKSLSSKNKQIF